MSSTANQEDEETIVLKEQEPEGFTMKKEIVGLPYEESATNQSPTIEDLIRRVEEFVTRDVRDIESLILPDEDLENFPDPQITSSDPYERRVARRLRIRNKLAAKRKQHQASIKKEMGEDEDEDDKYDPDNVVENQIESSTVRLLELIQDGRELISNIKVAAVSYEVKRRDKVRLERAERREKLEAAAEQSRIAFMEISNRWAAVKAEKDPLDIDAATEEQRKMCADVIAKKDAIIEALKKELEEADVNFVKDLERQEEEMDILVRRINQQVNIMREASQTELQLLQAAIAVEREEMMKANETEWEDMIDKKEFIESETDVIRNRIMEKHDKSIDAMETDQRELLKIKRTHQTYMIHEMQLGLQELEALCLFNAEKLNHNYRVLKKRADENQIIKSQQKRTITKLQDTVSNLRKKMTKKESSLSNETKRMSNELASLNRNIKEMEKRCSESASRADFKFLSLWDFNQAQAEQLLQKIMHADKIMYEQFLDTTAPPSEIIKMRKEDLHSYKNTINYEHIRYNVKEKETTTIVEKELKGRTLRAVLEAISRYASFLIEDSVKQVVNEFSPEDRIIVRLDKILTTLGVENSKEISSLVNHILPHMYCKTCFEQGVTSQSPSPNLEPDQVESPEQGSCAGSFDGVAATDDQRRDEVSADGDVMEAISSSVRQRISVIDAIVSREVSAVLLPELDSQEFPQPYDSQAELAEPDRQDIMRETIEIIPYNMAHFFRTNIPTTTIVPSSQVHHFSAGRYSLERCLQEQHEVSIDRLVMVKALCAYSKHLSASSQLKNTKSLTNKLSENWNTVSRSISNQDIQTFWKQLDVVSKEKEQLWDAFIQGLKEYHSQLTERARLNEEMKRMKKNNEDLMRLLDRYLCLSTEQASEADFPKIIQCINQEQGGAE